MVHSVFDAAANIVFVDGFVLSLNASSSARMPNGLQLSASPGSFPFSALRAGMPVLLGAYRLHIEALDCSLDLSSCSRWNPHIERPEGLDRGIIKRNGERIAERVWNGTVPVGARGRAERSGGLALALVSRPIWPFLFDAPTTTGSMGDEGDSWHRDDEGRASAPTAPLLLSRPYERIVALAEAYHESVLEMAEYLCGRGVGLTPAGDDMLAGWMAINWLLHGPQPAFLEACRQIVEVARRRTHLLSQCWLGYAAQGDVAMPVKALLETMTREDDQELDAAIDAVLSMGATSGHDLIQGILLGLGDGDLGRSC